MASTSYFQLKLRAKLEEVEQELALTKLENEVLLTKAELNLVD